MTPHLCRQRDRPAQLGLHLQGGHGERAARGEEPQREDQTGHGARQVSRHYNAIEKPSFSSLLFLHDIVCDVLLMFRSSDDSEDSGGRPSPVFAAPDVMRGYDITTSTPRSGISRGEVSRRLTWNYNAGESLASSHRLMPPRSSEDEGLKFTFENLILYN